MKGLSQKQKKKTQLQTNRKYNKPKQNNMADNKKTGKLGKECQEIWLQGDDKKIIHPQEVADTFNSYFIDKVEELMEKIGVT
jgi:hypothetical protein